MSPRTVPGGVGVVSAWWCRTTFGLERWVWLCGVIGLAAYVYACLQP